MWKNSFTWCFMELETFSNFTIFPISALQGSKYVTLYPYHFFFLQLSSSFLYLFNLSFHALVSPFLSRFISLPSSSLASSRSPQKWVTTSFFTFNMSRPCPSLPTPLLPSPPHRVPHPALRLPWLSLSMDCYQCRTKTLNLGLYHSFSFPLSHTMSLVFSLLSFFPLRLPPLCRVANITSLFKLPSPPLLGHCLLLLVHLFCFLLLFFLFLFFSPPLCSLPWSLIWTKSICTECWYVDLYRHYTSPIIDRY